MKHARVVGAGLSGLTTAWSLVQSGFDVEIVEASDHIGGLLSTTRTAHGLVERGANAFVWNATTARWFDELGLTAVFPSARSKRRFIYRDGRPRRWPLTMGETATMAGALGRAWLAGRARPEGRESVAAWGRRVIGGPATEKLLAPALQGIYAASADRLAARAIFAGSQGGRRRFGGVQSAAPDGGMGEFVARLTERLQDRGTSIRLNAPVSRLDLTTPTVIATDVKTAARMLEAEAPDAHVALSAVETTPIRSATAFFERRPDDLDGFGVLFPRTAGVDALGVLFNSVIFAQRGERFRSETWIYGPDPSTPDVPASRLYDRIRSDRQTLVGRDDNPVALYEGWTRAALPVYGLAVLDAREAERALPPGVVLAGNYLGRLGVSKLLEVSTEAAARLAEQTGRH